MSPKGYNLNQYNKGEIKLRLQELDPPKQVKAPRPICENFQSYMSNTTLHGFRYITDSNISWSERLWWLIMVVCSIMVCFFLIRKVWIKWEESPVIVSFADTSNSAWNIPFPAVTFCIETKPKQRVFNFTRAFEELHADPSTISKENLTIFHDMLLLCNYASDPNGGPEVSNASAVATMRRLAPTMDEVFLFCLWKGLTCSQMFSHTLTKDGICFTFNMLSEEQLFRTENLHKNYKHVEGRNRSSWTLGDGYSDNETSDTYPLRGPSYGGEEFEVVLLTDPRDVDLTCRGPIQGFKIWLHNPAELPNMGQNFFRLPINYQSAAAVLPRVTETTEGLRPYPPHKRGCFFPMERYLRFFRTYTQRNCELECASNYTVSSCDCAPVYMPPSCGISRIPNSSPTYSRDGPEAEICGPARLKCVKEALANISLSKSALDQDTIHLAKKCDCLQACTEIKYDAEVSQAVYHENAYRFFNSNKIQTIRWDNRKEVAEKLKLPSGLVIYFAEELFTSLRRSELYGNVDFIANCGGIMGLFMGFSFLSVVEIAYYCTIRLWCQIQNTNTVVAQ